MGSTPRCDLKSGLCAGCRVDGDCVGNARACQPSGACGQCSANNAAACGGQTPACDATRGQCVLCTVSGGDGGAAGDARACANAPNGHACELDGRGAFCGCGTDGDCGATDSGRICDVLRMECIDGCSPAVLRNHCPVGLSCTSTDASGLTVGSCSMHCVMDADCGATPALPYCIKDGGGTSTCAACRGDADCATRVDGELVCAPDSHSCVQCTVTSRAACTSDGPGRVCLADARCGCGVDGDCGAIESGRLCDDATHRCASGCRGQGGNGCGPSSGAPVCSSTDHTPGICGPRSVADASASSEMGSSDLGGGPSRAGGLGCSVAQRRRGGDSSTSTALLESLSLALALAGFRLRHRRDRVKD